MKLMLSLAGGALALFFGLIAAYLAHAILFTSPTSDLLPQILLPIGLLAATNFVAVLAAPLYAKTMAALTAAPTVLFSGLFFIFNLIEGKTEPDFLVAAAAAPVITFAVAMVTTKLKMN